MDKKDGEVPATPCFNAEEEAACAYRQARGSCYCGFGVFVSFGLLFVALESFGMFPDVFMQMRTVLFVLLMFLPVVMAVAAIVLGRSALILIGPGSEDPTARRSAVFGLALGCAGFLLWMLPVMAALWPHGPCGPRRSSCRTNLQQSGLVLKMWENESKKHLFPSLYPEPGRLFFAEEEVDGPLRMTKFLGDFRFLRCPNVVSVDKALDGVTDPGILLNDHTYFYLSHVVMSDGEMAAFAAAYREAVALGPKALNEDFIVPAGSGNKHGDRLFRLRGAIESVLAGEDPSRKGRASEEFAQRIPVLIERLGNHKDPGGNVLYLDGHVEFVPYPGPFPMTKETVALLESLDAMGPPPIGKTRTDP